MRVSPAQPRMVLRPILSLLFASLLLAGPLFSDELEGLPVREIRIETAAINQQHLQELLAIQPNDAYSAGKVRQSIRRLYATGRFLDIQVDAQRQADGLTLTFITRENYFVGGVFVAGVRGSPNRGQLVNGTGLQFGELWTEGKRERAVEGLRRLLEEHGFYQARIEPRVELHPEIQQVNIHFEIQAGERAHITQVQVTGAPGFPRETVLRAAKLKPGQQVTPQRLQKAVRRLRNYYRKRTYLEADIGVAERRYLPEENGLLPVLEVNRGPQVEVNVVGAKLSGSKRRELLPIYTEGSVDADLVREGKNNLQDFYQRRGHFDVEVEAHIREEPSAKEPKDGKVVVEYRVAPGPDHQVELVEISGNHYFDMATLRERMLVAEKGLISDGRFSSDLLRRDMGAIRSLYVANGFRNVQVASEVLDDYQDKLGHIAVRLRVDEGPQMLVRKLTIEGAQGIPAQQLRTRVACDDGQPFSDFNVLLDRATLLSQYFNRGFPEATFSWEVKPVHGGQEQVDLIYKISEGPRQYVDRVLISGLDTTRRYIVDQQLLLEEGEPLSQLDILETQRRLYDFGIFEKVEIAVQNREGKEKFKNAMVQIEEGGRYTVSVGGGVDVARFRGATEEATDPEGEAGISPLVSFEVTRLNFRGRNHTLSFKSRLSRLQERVLASYTAPRFWNEPRLTLLLSGFAERSFDVLTFASQRVEGSIALQQKRGRSDTLLYRYSYRRVKAERDTLKVSVEDIPLFARPVRVGMLGATFVRDRRDDPVDPYRGMLLTSDVGFSSARLGSEANFSRFVGQFSTYHRLGQNLVLARNTQLGVAEPFGKPGKVLNEQGGPDIPLPERFFSGGGNSHRGFGVNQAGPRDRETGFPVGGRVLLLNSLELRFPVSGKKVGGVLFHDMGNLFARLDDISFRVKQRNLTDFSYMVHAVGAGVRYKTPIGPLRLGRTGLQITRLHWETPRSSLSLSGQIFASAQPRILLNYEAGLDVGEIAAVSQISELRSGRLQLNRNFLFGLPAFENIHASASQRVQCFLREDHRLRASLSGSPKTVQSASKPSFFRQLSMPGG